MNNELYKNLIKEEADLLLRLKHIKELKKLYSPTDGGLYAKEEVLNIIKELGSTDVKKIADTLGKSPKTIDNLCRTLIKEKQIQGVKKGRRIVYSVK